jgi:GGDEF domain-containing protein
VTPRDVARKTEGQDGVAVSFLVGLFHSLQHAGLSRRTLKNAVNNMKIAWWGDELPVTASFGGATVVSGDNEQSLLKRAENALAKSIAAGGDRVTIAN